MAKAHLLSLNLLLTYRCNCLCRHCISDCGPNRTEAMSFDQGRSYIDAAVATTTIETIGYTGGEPFLCYPLLEGLCAYTWERYGIPQGAVTNCAWAKSPEFAASRLARLHARGLRYLTVSCDSFHLEYVKPAAIRSVVHAALDLGITVGINATVTRTGALCKTNLPEFLDLDRDDLGDRLFIKEFGPLLIGRAATGCSAEDLIATDETSCFDGICRFVMRTPAIAPDGSLYGCCCFGDAEQEPERKIAYVGNVNRHSLRTLMRTMRQNLLLTLLARRGPYLSAPGARPQTAKSADTRALFHELRCVRRVVSQRRSARRAASMAARRGAH